MDGTIFGTEKRELKRAFVPQNEPTWMQTLVRRFWG
jgi:hypothetical protein